MLNSTTILVDLMMDSSTVFAKDSVGILVDISTPMLSSCTEDAWMANWQVI